eukprot:m.30319 g.30319  ORF g.30319 m.30319 type:complete len:570 (-) comp9407_c0_seq2:7-1716(-)
MARCLSCSNLVVGCLVLYCLFSAWHLSGFWFPEQCDSRNRQHRPCLPPLYNARRTHVDLQVFRTKANDPGRVVPSFLTLDRTRNSTLILQATDVDPTEPSTWDVNVSIPDAVRRNGSLGAVVFITPHGVSPDPQDATYDKTLVVSFVTKLTQHMPRRDANKTMLVASDEDVEQSDDVRTDKPVTHWRPRLVLRYVDDQSIFPGGQLPGDFRLPIVRQRDAKPAYQPIFYADDFGMLHRDWVPLSSNVSRPPPRLRVELGPESLGMYRFLIQMSASTSLMKEQAGLTDKDIDDVKAIFTETSITYLLFTYAISILHMVFDFLAFKNDVGFWKGRENLAGLSRRAVVMNCICTAIIFLYLFDNEQTSILILGTVGISLLIEAWKVTKVFKISFGWHGWLPYIAISSVRSKAEASTEQFDATAMAWLSLVLYPLVAAVAVYSLVYNPHKSWYSWLLESLANGVYMFGFVMMTPQLFINYKLKSVAHLPWRVFMYKAFSTFVDDAFSFMIKMPTAHRLACLRDDVVFFVYLYQRWLYPVDKTRVNEFGYAYEEEPKEGADGHDTKSEAEKKDQ